MTQAVSPFLTFAVSRRAHEMKAAGRHVIHMEFGQPSTGAPAAAIAAAQHVLATEPMGYWDSAPLRNALAGLYRSDYGQEIDPERIILTCGASPALVLACTVLFRPGDRVALARPGYVAYRNTLRGLHLEPVELACGPEQRFLLTAEQIAALDPPPAGLIVASPANPTGAILTGHQLGAIAAACRARGIAVISDEIYHGLSYGAPARSMLEVAPDATVINSFSKYFSMAGWRLGWLVCAPDRIASMRAHCANFFLTPPSLSQHAGLAALGSRAELDRTVAVYRQNRALLLDALPRMGLRDIAPPDGAFYIYAATGHLAADSLGLAQDLLEETGVATATGRDFDPVDGGKFLRFSFAITTEETRDAIRRLEPAFRRRLRQAG